MSTGHGDGVWRGGRRPRQGRPARPPGGPAGARALLTATLALLALAALYLALLGGRAPGFGAPVGGAWALTGSDGRHVTDRDFRGRSLLLYFGYTNCPDICPATLAVVAEALRRLGARARNLQPVFVTIDPARDTPRVLARYVASFGVPLIGLGGSAAETAMIERNYGVQTALRRTATGYSVDHTAVLYLIGPDGRFIAPIAADDTAAEMADDIARHLP